MTIPAGQIIEDIFSVELREGIRVCRSSVLTPVLCVERVFAVEVVWAHARLGFRRGSLIAQECCLGGGFLGF